MFCHCLILFFQAAIGSQALDYARIHNLRPELQVYGSIVRYAVIFFNEIYDFSPKHYFLITLI